MFAEMKAKKDAKEMQEQEKRLKEQKML